MTSYDHRISAPVMRAGVRLALAGVLAACARPTAPVTAPTTLARAADLAHAVVPAPASITVTPGEWFVVDSTTRVAVAGAAGEEALRIADWVARLLTADQRPGAVTAQRLAAGESTPAGAITLVLDASRTNLGEEGYELASSSGGVTLTAARPAGLFYAAQTLRQMLPAAVELPAAMGRRLRVPAARITDRPRFAWRGMMLDVSRHFLPASDVKRFIDHVSAYKMNRLHLHLSDDQGWRVEIKSWPELTRIGGATQVGGGPGGFYTQDELRDLVAYARDRYVTIVPEFDMPGHTNAALASYGSLNCDGVARPAYTGTRVGFSAVCVEKDSTYKFVEDLVREVGAITGPYFHIGGDEVEKLTPAQYKSFIERVEKIVRAQGKTMVGWADIAPAALDPSTIVQNWHNDSAAMHARRGGKVIISTGAKAYLDMKYDSLTTLGLRWAGLVSVRTAYDWDPATVLAGVGESSVIGVESPLWSETVTKREDFEFLAFPRLLAIAEIGWSPQASRRWDDFSQRLGAQGPRLQALGINFHRSPEVPWLWQEPMWTREPAARPQPQLPVP